MQIYADFFENNLSKRGEAWREVFNRLQFVTDSSLFIFEWQFL